MNTPGRLPLDRRRALAELRAWLVQHRNPDGGWGYYPSKASRLEPTCWALLALSRADRHPLEVALLGRWPRNDSWFSDVTGTPVNYAFNALAALALSRHPDGLPDATRVAQSLLGVRGVAFRRNDAMQQDNSLQAWPWIDATFSWVEPTSLCLLLLKRLRNHLPTTATNQRIDVGERLLVDRACPVGGWNYGNSNVYGQELHPYVPTTALGLLAMQDRPNEPVVGRALDWLKQEAPSEPSALSLALIALRVFSMDSPAIERLVVDCTRIAVARENTLSVAAGLYALTRSPRSDDVFAL